MNTRLIQHNIALVSILLVVFVFTSCKEEDEPTSFIDIIYAPGDQEFGFARGAKNGLAWESSAYWTYGLTDSSRIGISFLTYEPSTGFEREAVDLFSIPLSIGDYSLFPRDIGIRQPSSTLFFLAADGDAIIAGLQLDSTRNNFVNITSYDPVSTSIAGSFTLHYELDGETRLSYENCEFEARLFRE